MKVRPHARGIYADARAGSEVCALIGEAAIVYNGLVVPAPSEMMFCRLSESGTVVAAKAHAVGHCWVYDGREWTDTGQDSYGSNGHVWTPGGLHVFTGGPHAPSTGFAYFRDRAVWTWEVYEPKSTMGQPRLYIAIDLGDGIYLGQGDSGGAVILHPTLGHRLLCEGPTVFINAHREGDRIVGGLHRERPYLDAVTFDFHVSEIASLPLYPKPQPDPVKPPPKPVPEPEPVMPWTPKMPDRTEVVDRLKTAHPEEWAAMNIPGGHDTRFIRRLAWVLHQEDPAFGLNGKRGNVNDLSLDCVAYLNSTLDNGPEVADVVIGHESPDARPGWINVTVDSQGWDAHGHKHEQGGAGAAWVRPEPVAGTDPGPVKPPPIDAGELADLRAEVARLEKRLATLAEGCVKIGDAIALKSGHGTYVCADNDHKDVAGVPLYANREGVAGWETFTVEKGQR